MTTTTPTFCGTFKGRTAQQWRDAARHSRQQAHESWERSDTDGFLSQWASGKTAQEYDLFAELAETDGWHEFTALLRLDGSIATTRMVKGDYGWSWVIPAADDGRPTFVSTSEARKGATRLARDEAKGYRLGTVVTKAYTAAVGDMISLRYVPRPHSKMADPMYVVDDGLTPGGWYKDR